MASVRELISADRPFYCVILAYLATSLAIAAYLGDLRWFVPMGYIGASAVFVVTGITIYLAVRTLRSDSPVRAFRLELMNFWQSRGAGLVLFLFLAMFQGAFTSIKVMMPEFVPFTFDPALADLDEWIHFGAAWEHLRFLDGHTALLRFLYTPVWMAVYISATLLICLSRASRLRTQYIWTFIWCWIVLGNVFALGFMSVGPIFYEPLLGDTRFAGLTAHLQTVTSPDDPLSQIPQALWLAYTEKLPGMGTGISAFPSLHLAITTLIVLVAFRLRAWLGWVMAAYLCVIMVGSVHLGWHYAIDGYFALAATFVLWKVVGLRLASQMPASCPAPGVLQLSRVAAKYT